MRLSLILKMDEIIQTQTRVPRGREKERRRRRKKKKVINQSDKWVIKRECVKGDYEFTRILLK